LLGFYQLLFFSGALFIIAAASIRRLLKMIKEIANSKNKTINK
jgi:hypothetical protein